MCPGQLITMRAHGTGCRKQVIPPLPMLGAGGSYKGALPSSCLPSIWIAPPPMHSSMPHANARDCEAANYKSWMLNSGTYGIAEREVNHCMKSVSIKAIVTSR